MVSVWKRPTLMIDTSIHRCKKRESRGDQVIALIGRSLLLFCMVLGLMGISGCVSPESIDMDSFDPAQDQKAIARYYWNQAIAMREKAKAQATAAARYEALFGAEADLVSGAKSLAHYYEQTAQELERVAQAHAAVDRNTRTPRAVP
jgi:outer membrane murein-binding lipoprotein Lpp